MDRSTVPRDPRLFCLPTAGLGVERSSGWKLIRTEYFAVKGAGYGGR